MINNKLTYAVTPEIVGGETISIMEEINGQFYKTVINLKEKAIQDALIALGWKPPSSCEVKP